MVGIMAVERAKWKPGSRDENDSDWYKLQDEVGNENMKVGRYYARRNLKRRIFLARRGGVGCGCQHRLVRTALQRLAGASACSGLSCSPGSYGTPGKSG
jgi:hypothetical protein